MDILRAKGLRIPVLIIRGVRVMIDADLAVLYGVPTKRLNEQVRRNADRFPPDFMFRLTEKEKAEVVANCDHLRNLRFSPVAPAVFTEFGALMLANVLNSPRAIRASIQIVRAFLRMRGILETTGRLAARLDALEARDDSQFREVFDHIRRLILLPEEPRPRIGFRP